MRHAWMLVLLASLASRSADAKCAMMGLAPEVLTPTGATIPPGGGIVVGAVSAQDASLDNDAATQPGWRLRLGARVAEPVRTILAPGLVLYTLPADAKEATLIDDKRATVGKVTVGARPAALAAPKIKRIAHDARLGKRPFATVQIELSAPAPDGVVALVIADGKGKPRSWGPANAGTTSVLGYQRQRCEVLSNGTIESKPGERVSVYWIDAGGRKSAASTATIAGAKPNPDEDD